MAHSWDSLDNSWHMKKDTPDNSWQITWNGLDTHFSFTLQWKGKGEKIWDVLQESEVASFNKFCTILKNFQLYWTIFLVYLGLTWSILVYLSWPWTFLVYLSLSWSISVYLVLSRSLLGNLEISRDILGYIRLSMELSPGILGYLELL